MRRNEMWGTMLLTIIILLTQTLWSQVVQVDLKDLGSDARNAVIKANNPDSKSISVDDVEKYSRIGQAIGEAFKSVCTTLNVEVNAFVKTPVGKLTVVMVAWKIFGDDIKGVCGAFLFILIMYPAYFILFRHFFMQRKIKLGNEIKLIRYDWDSRDLRAGVITTFSLAAFAWILVPILMVFA